MIDFKVWIGYTKVELMIFCVDSWKDKDMNNAVASQEKFDSILLDVIGRYGIRSIVLIPGIYEILAEYFNNEVIFELLSY